jgi:hypothetical protein
MDEVSYEEFLDAYKKWAALPYHDDEPYSDHNKRRQAAWEQYTKLRDIYYSGAKLIPPPEATTATIVH